MDDRRKVLAARENKAAPVRLGGKAALPALALGLTFLFAGCETSGLLSKQGKGVAEVANQSPEEAAANLASLTDVIQRNPSSSEAYNTRGTAYARLGKFQEAIADFSQAIKLDQNSAAALTNRALAYRQLGQ
ncbi:MAG: tetratricopeptide repeat protein, partial [Beijerinckiaceae bacterium]|nr:tetratricopeptide repeat protein [Beijerinckiaceae bacterium]